MAAQKTQGRTRAGLLRAGLSQASDLTSLGKNHPPHEAARTQTKEDAGKCWVPGTHVKLGPLITNAEMTVKVNFPLKNIMAEKVKKVYIKF